MPAEFIIEVSLCACRVPAFNRPLVHVCGHSPSLHQHTFPFCVSLPAARQSNSRSKHKPQGQIKPQRHDARRDSYRVPLCVNRVSAGQSKPGRVSINIRSNSPVSLASIFRGTHPTGHCRARGRFCLERRRVAFRRRQAQHTSMKFKERP
jgi:hypothetical protein